ncbi:phospholipase A2 inhibitor gamma subunit B-like isoform X2 [Ascaphus truei]|uniref:phospholipase A2 inhibitor gamma subunit B-like isoform X2 n=1 Tax=Ascaphus truei TaxID=8439 RepID=UPI003F5AC3C8
MNFTFRICVLSAFITAGISLKCTKCVDYQGKLCTGEVITCNQTNDVCISSFVQNEIDTANPASALHLQGKDNQTPIPSVLVRECGSPSDCEEVIILRTPYNRLVISNKCCTSDLCNPGIPPSIPEGSWNGRSCPGCLSVTSNVCAVTETVSCRGTENYCFSFSLNPQISKKDTLSMSGCTTVSACGYVYGANTVMCSSTSISTRDPSNILTSGSSHLHLTMLSFTVPLIRKLLY